jgi:hypothetical protein
VTLFDVSGFDSGFDCAEPELEAAAVPPEQTQTQTQTPERVDQVELPPDATPPVEVRVSARRRKTSEARWEGDRIVVSLPAHLDPASRQSTIDWLVERLLSRHRRSSGLSDADLLARAITLSKRYLVGARPVSVRWVTNQTARWGSCSYYSGEIRVSHRLRPVPEWVLDSVLVHELAHLTHPDHSPEFHRLANGFPRHQEAAVFLAGYGLGLSQPTCT